MRSERTLASQGSRLSPSQLAVATLLGLILLGTGLLLLPISHAPGAKVSALDAFFTSTSALCVTGLVVNDIGTTFSPFGHSVILGLIEIGGMGMLLWSSTMILLLGGHLGLRHRLLMKDQLPGLTIAGAGRLTLNIVGFVLAIELAGALALWAMWHERIPGWRGFYYAFFHSASAFCNAGFSLWPDSLAQDATNPGVCFVIVALVVFGGLGYAVVRDLADVMMGRRRRLSVHSLICLYGTGILLIGGSALFVFFESTHGGVLQARSGFERVVMAVFQIGNRTSGLSSVPTDALHPETLQLLMALMFIGGSTGSTAGGLKVTTIAILVIAAWSQARGRTEVEVFGRRLKLSLVLQALAMTVIAALFVLAFAFTLNFVERLPFLDVLFETISALAIVGLSTGITPHLSAFSKLLLCFAMVIGRIGPLTLAMSLLRPRRASLVRYPEEDILIG